MNTIEAMSRWGWTPLGVLAVGCDMPLPLHRIALVAGLALAAEQLRNGFPRRLNRQLDDDGKRQPKTFIEGELAVR